MSSAGKPYLESLAPETPAARLWEIAKSNRGALRVARNPSAPGPLLEVLSRRGSPALSAAVASHPNTPPSALLWLATRSPMEVLGNPALPLLLLESPALLQEMLPGLLRRLQRLRRYPAVPGVLLEAAAASQAPLARTWAASHSDTPPALVEKLVEDDVWMVRHAALENPKAPAARLALLVRA